MQLQLPAENIICELCELQQRNIACARRTDLVIKVVLLCSLVLQSTISDIDMNQLCVFPARTRSESLAASKLKYDTSGLNSTSMLQTGWRMLPDG